MKSTELRIGNYVTHQIHDIGTVEYIGDAEILYTRNFNSIPIKDVQPIPLTKEWLLSFGFEKPAHSWCGDKFHLSTWDKYPDCWCVALNKNSGILVDKLKHVHQLQNLYHALTNEELKIKE